MNSATRIDETSTGAEWTRPPSLRSVYCLRRPAGNFWDAVAISSSPRQLKLQMGVAEMRWRADQSRWLDTKMPGHLRKRQRDEGQTSQRILLHEPFAMVALE